MSSYINTILSWEFGTLGKKIINSTLIGILFDHFNFYRSQPSQIPNVEAIALFSHFSIPIQFPFFPYLLLFFFAKNKN
jgi:hypothetical protein